jgi:hypothetical protein
MIEVVSGASGGGVDWHKIWLASPERAAVNEELARMKSEALTREPSVQDESRPFATTLFTQLRLVTHRQQIALWRNPVCTSIATFWLTLTYIIDLCMGQSLPPRHFCTFRRFHILDA